MIEFGGLIVSEYYIGTEPRTFNFPARNRLLAALSRVTLVVQAHHKSGSLITAREAIEQGKTVVTLPARIIDGGYSGNLELIKNGAHIVTSSQELCDLVGLEQRQMDFQKPEFGSDLEMRIYESLSIDPLEFDILSQKLNLDTTELATHLSMMELQGYVKNIGENRWVALV
jgi:DNA processing protein